MVDSFKNNASGILTVAVVFLSLLGTQFLFPINLMGRTLYLYYVEIFLILMFFAVAIYMLAKRQKPVISKTEFILLALFIAWFVVLTGYRYISSGDITGGFIVFRVLTFPIIMMLLLRQMGAQKRDMVLGLLSFSTCMNVYQIYSLFFISHSFRIIKALYNINIYLCFMLAAMPIFVFLLKNFKSRTCSGNIVLRAVVLFNIIVISIFTLFSGSRLALVMLPISLIGSFFSVSGFSKKSFINFLVICLACVVSVVSIVRANLYDARYNITRTLAPIMEIIKYEPEVTPPTSEPTQEELANTNVAESNVMRDIIWEKAIGHIIESPFWGRTTVDIEFEMYFSGQDEPVKMVQSPHNFIMESWMALGLPGMCVYFTILILLALSVLRKKMKAAVKINFLLSMFVIFGCSFFQPLVTCYFAVSIVLWIGIYLYTQKDISTEGQQLK